MTVAESEPFTDQDLTLVFAKELKRLATLVEKSCRINDGIQMLSSLAAINPLVKLLSETALTTLSNKQLSGDEAQVPTNRGPLDAGYL